MRALRFLIVGMLVGAVAVALVWRLTPPSGDAIAPSPSLGGGSTLARVSSSPPPSANASANANAASDVYPVERVVDGDTIAVIYEGVKTTVRLIGVDTPETVHPNKPVERFGKEASAFTKKTLANESVRLEFDKERFDRYGRTLAYVYRASDGLFVNEELIRQGFAHAYTRFPFERLDRFRQLESEAREAGRGLWADSPAEPAAEPTGEVVYVTASGKKYHRPGCRALRRSATAISLSDARRDREPCSVCKPPR